MKYKLAAIFLITLFICLMISPKLREFINEIKFTANGGAAIFLGLITIEFFLRLAVAVGTPIIQMVKDIYGNWGA